MQFNIIKIYIYFIFEFFFNVITLKILFYYAYRDEIKRKKKIILKI